MYLGAGPADSDWVVRIDSTGIEDHVWFETRPEVESSRYDIDVSGVAGLRFVSGVLEFLDASGTPRFRVSAPFALDREGQRHTVRMTLRDCDADRDPRAPWGRAVTAPGASRCGLDLAWGRAIGDHDLRYPALVDPKWTVTTTMAVTRCDHTATELGDGRVLVAGGYDNFPIAEAEVYDRTTNTFAVTAPLSIERALAKSVSLLDGKALVTGGYRALYAGGIETQTTADLYDPSTGTWSTSVMTVPHGGHALVRLDDGRVVAASGTTKASNGTKTTVVDVYDPATNTWSKVGDLSVGRAQVTGSLLLDGRILIAGGGASPTTYPDTEVIDPTDWSIESVEPLARARQAHAAARLLDGRVLVAGGADGQELLDSVELFDPATNTWSDGPKLPFARYLHTATAHPNGFVYLVGGFYDGPNGYPVFPKAVDAYDPNLDAILPTVSGLNQARNKHTTTLLSDGALFAAGGDQSADWVLLDNAELLALGATGEPCQWDADCVSGNCAGVCGGPPSDGGVESGSGNGGGGTGGTNWDAAFGGSPVVEAGPDAGSDNPRKRETSDDGGCGCRTVPDQASGFRSLVVGLALLSMLQRRRQRLAVRAAGIRTG